MSKIKSILCAGDKETTDVLNELKKKGHNLSMNIISITQDMGIYTIFYNDIFD